MIFPQVVRHADGRVTFEGLMPLYVSVLLELPDLLRPEVPDPVRDRLYPDPSDDEEQRKDWERLVRPELFALVASAREIVQRDLARLAPDDPFQGIPRWRVEIPGKHVNAWISGINAARLSLGALHSIETEEDLRPDLEPREGRAEIDERTLAILKINVLAELQYLLICDGLPDEQRPPRTDPEEGLGEEDQPG